MVSSQANPVFRHMYNLLARQVPDERSDRELLRSFGHQGDENAFSELVRRHGLMVLATCCRVLANADDADDAFQAAFLVLARKARSKGRQESVANWLYAVAYPLAVRLGGDIWRRRCLETRQAAPSYPDSLAAVSGRELCVAIDEKLSRLPERLRARRVL
jgi:DNA-directed RNA polymerase specialized sigma24 family protein